MKAEELKAIADWYRLVFRVSLALSVVGVAVGIYHGPLMGWLAFWACFNAWIARRNYVLGLGIYLRGEPWQNWTLPFGISVMCTSAATINVATMLL